MAVLKLRFKGVKKIIYPESLSHEKNIKEFWHKLFGDLSFPICPFCKKEMTCRNISLDTKVEAIPYYFGQRKQMAFRTPMQKMEVIFSCECGSEMDGEGQGLKINADMTFEIEKFVITKIKGKEEK